MTSKKSGQSGSNTGGPVSARSRVWAPDSLCGESTEHPTDYQEPLGSVGEFLHCNLKPSRSYPRRLVMAAEMAEWLARIPGLLMRAVVVFVAGLVLVGVRQGKIEIEWDWGILAGFAISIFALYGFVANIRRLWKFQIFDFEAGCYWCARNPLGKIRQAQGGDDRKYIKFEDIVSIVVAEKKRTYYIRTHKIYMSYELNMIIKDGRKVNLAENVSREKILQQRQIVCEFMQEYLDKGSVDEAFDAFFGGTTHGG